MAEKQTEKLNASVSYDGEGELLIDISDKQLKPLKKTNKKTKKSVKKVTKKVTKKVVEILKENKEKSEKEIYEEILNSGDFFMIIYNNITIYDSEKNKDKVIAFQDDVLILNNETIPYIGLKIKFKK